MEEIELTEDEKFTELKRIYMDVDKEALYEYISNKNLILHEIYNKFLRKWGVSIGTIQDEFTIIAYSIFVEEKQLLKIINTQNYYEMISMFGNMLLDHIKKDIKTGEEKEILELKEEFAIPSAEDNLEDNHLFSKEKKDEILKKLNYKGEERIIATLMLKENISLYAITKKILNPKNVNKHRTMVEKMNKKILELK